MSDAIISIFVGIGAGVIGSLLVISVIGFSVMVYEFTEFVLRKIRSLFNKIK